MNECIHTCRQTVRHACIRTRCGVDRRRCRFRARARFLPSPRAPPECVPDSCTPTSPLALLLPRVRAPFLGPGGATKGRATLDVEVLDEMRQYLLERLPRSPVGRHLEVDRLVPNDLLEPATGFRSLAAAKRCERVLVVREALEQRPVNVALALAMSKHKDSVRPAASFLCQRGCNRVVGHCAIPRRVADTWAQALA